MSFMQIYTSNCYGEDLERVRQLGMGIMIASSGSGFMPTKEYKDLPCALDNGAFQCWTRGYPFMDRFFWHTLEKCYSLGLELNFVVCPDLVACGQESLLFSMRYATDRLRGCARLALAVQDGMTPEMVQNHTENGQFSCIFVGGTLDWKWQTAAEWVRFAHDSGSKCHIGRCGTIEALERAASIGADSVDSASFVRNDAWEIIERFRTGQAHPLFD